MRVTSAPFIGAEALRRVLVVVCGGLGDTENGCNFESRTSETNKSMISMWRGVSSFVMSAEIPGGLRDC
jgi:hypothetical protein